MPDPREEENKKAEKEKRENAQEIKNDAKIRSWGREEADVQQKFEKVRSIIHDTRKGWTVSNNQLDTLIQEEIEYQDYDNSQDNQKVNESIDNNNEKSKFEEEEFDLNYYF